MALHVSSLGSAGDPQSGLPSPCLQDRLLDPPWHMVRALLFLLHHRAAECSRSFLLRTQIVGRGGEQIQIHTNAGAAFLGGYNRWLTWLSHSLCRPPLPPGCARVQVCALARVAMSSSHGAVSGSHPGGLPLASLACCPRPVPLLPSGFGRCSALKGKNNSPICLVLSIKLIFFI